MLKQGLSQKLLQKLSPQQIQFIQLLQLNTIELEKRVDEELTENPALESEKTDVGDPMDMQSENPDFNNNEGENNAEPESEENDYDDYEVDISDYMGDDDGGDYGYSTDNGSDEERRVLTIAEQRSLYDILNEQLAAIRLDAREKELAKHLIGMIEEDGYMRRPLKNIAYDMAF